MVKFNSTNTTAYRNKMYAGVAANKAKPCSGGYDQQLYSNVAALWARGPFIVSQNCECTQTAFLLWRDSNQEHYVCTMSSHGVCFSFDNTELQLN
jgi:hypothetical protein